MRTNSSSPLKVLGVPGVLVETEKCITRTSGTVTKATALGEQTALPYHVASSLCPFQVVFIAC